MLILPVDASKVSDGYHTFEELYEHRCLLFIKLISCCPHYAWYSLKHEDGSEIKDWFIAGIQLPTGMITYHLPDKYWHHIQETKAVELEYGMKWDGHTSQDVVKRLEEDLSSPIAEKIS